MTTQLLSLADAARYLGCRPRTLRKLIDRSRLRLKGIPVKGPTIQFAQAFPYGPILFRRAWLDAYIEVCTKRPETTPLLTRIARPRKAAPPPVASLPGAPSQHGFFQLPTEDC